jgi:hypothetical protein
MTVEIMQNEFEKVTQSFKHTNINEIPRKHTFTAKVSILNKTLGGVVVDVTWKDTIASLYLFEGFIGEYTDTVDVAFPANVYVGEAIVEAVSE